jgi:hypothetical protein
MTRHWRTPGRRWMRWVSAASFPAARSMPSWPNSSSSRTRPRSVLRNSPSRARRTRNSSTNFSPTRTSCCKCSSPTARSGKYGQAMKIYTDIQKASPKAKDGVFQRLAMATCLAHAVPIERRVEGGVRPADEPKSYIDPVQRYLSFEKWYEAGELHKGFKDLNVWNLRRVVDCIDPDEIMAWGRQMLHTLRPDCIPTMTTPGVRECGRTMRSAMAAAAWSTICPTALHAEHPRQRRHLRTPRVFHPVHPSVVRRAEHGTGGARSLDRRALASHRMANRLGGNWGKSNRGFYAKMGGGGGGPMVPMSISWQAARLVKMKPPT